VYILGYHEGDHVFKFGLELCGSQGEHDFILYTDSYLSRAWQPPFDKEDVRAEEKQKIVDRVLAALEFMGQKALVV
jgi:hypothetical protein